MCFYYNVMPQGCKRCVCASECDNRLGSDELTHIVRPKPLLSRSDDKCTFAHVYLDGALEARRRAEAEGLLPPTSTASSSGSDGEDGEGQHQSLQQPQQHPQLPPQPLQGPGGVPLPIHPAVLQQQMLPPPPPPPPPHHSAGRPGPGYPLPPVAVPAPSWHQPYTAPPPLHVGAAGPAAAAVGAGYEILYDHGATKVYIQMPRSRRTGQRVCYYHNVGKCTHRSCPFLHILVSAGWIRARWMGARAGSG